MANVGVDIPVAGGGSGTAAIVALLTTINASLAGSKRPLEFIEALAGGSTPDDVQNVSIFFDGTGGTLNGVSVPDGFSQAFAPQKGADTVAAEAFTVPTGGNLRVIIGYVDL